MSILISTIRDDMHAYVIADCLRKRFGCKAYIQEVDRLYASKLISIDLVSKETQVETLEGRVDLADIDVVWWRRSRADQVNISGATDEKIADLINQDSRAAWRGALGFSFRGVWVSDPPATEFASFKAIQLKQAMEIGLGIPNSIVSNDPRKIRDFASRFSSLIVKPVAGSRHLLTENRSVSASDLPADEVLAACPAIYQEFIPGNSHLRVNIFGSDVFAFEINCREDDWRQRLPTEISPVKLADTLQGTLIRYVALLGLKMGIVDLKRLPNGDVVFFEINPQGQFLFLEGITGFPLAERFAGFLFNEAQKRSSGELAGAYASPGTLSREDLSSR